LLWRPSIGLPWDGLEPASIISSASDMTHPKGHLLLKQSAKPY
jgi:hypothetical protein